MKIFQPTTLNGLPGTGTVTSVGFIDSLTSTPNPIVGSGTAQLVNDSAAPGNSQYYGTNSSGTKGFFPLGSLGGLTQNHFFVGNASNVPVDAGPNLTYSGSDFHMALGVGFGVKSALELSSTSSEIRMGYNTGTIGSESTIIGNAAALGNLGGSLWTLVGSNAGGTSGGAFATGARLTVVGRDAGAGSHGDNNTEIGASAGARNTGNRLAVLGQAAGFANSGDDISGVGYNILNTNSGSRVSILGKESAFLNSGNDAIGIGYHTLASNTFNDVAVIGTEAVATMNGQFVVGSVSNPIANWQIRGLDYVMPLSYGIGGAPYVFVDGTGAGDTSWVPISSYINPPPPIYPATLIPFGDGSTPGGITDSVPFGYDSTNHYLLLGDIIGLGNVMVGQNFGALTGNHNTAVGISALGSTTASKNTAIGYAAGNSIGGDNNVSIGFAANDSAVVNNTIAMGSFATATMDNQIVFGAATTMVGGVLIPNWLVNGVPWVMPASNSAGAFLNDGVGNLSWGAVVQSVNSGTDITVDNTDPANPIINFTGTIPPATTSTNPHTPITSNVLDFIDAVQMTKTAYATAVASTTAPEGYIMITDPTSASRVIFRSEFGNTSSTLGEGLFADADFQNVGDYSGVNSQTTGTFLGNWNGGLTPSIGDITFNAGIDNKYYTNISGANGSDPSIDPTNWALTQTKLWVTGGSYTINQVVIWNNKHWANITGTNTSTSPDSDPTNWTQIGSTAAGTGYIFIWDRILYDVITDTILFRYDKRGNQINGNSLATFQWGDDTQNNVITQDMLSNINNLNNFGQINGAYVGNGCGVTIVLNAGRQHSNCVYAQTGNSFTFDPAVSYIGKIVDNAQSTFDVQYLPNVTANIADLGTTPYAGIFRLTSGPWTISGFAGTIPQGFPIKFICNPGVSNDIFSPIPIASAVAGDLVSDGGDVNLTGRTSDADSDSYTVFYDGTFIQKITAVTLI